MEVVRAESERDQPVEECNGVTVYSAPVQNIYPPFSEPRSAPVRGIWHAIEDWQSSATLVSKRIQAFKPDCMHSNNLSGLTAAIWKSALDQDVPVVHTLHDYYLTCPRCSRFMAGHACERTCMSCEILTINRKRATRQLRAVVGVSQRGARYSYQTRPVFRYAATHRHSQRLDRDIETPDPCTFRHRNNIRVHRAADGRKGDR
ncbi:MAG: glycosyltransferase [Bradyrhizobium sp.]